MAEYPYPRVRATALLSDVTKPASSTDFTVSVGEVFDFSHALLLKKHKDYGPTNISRSPGGPLNGLRVRIWDKVARLNNLIDSGVAPENESLMDTFVDLMNYSAIAILVLKGEWPNE